MSKIILLRRVGVPENPGDALYGNPDCLQPGSAYSNRDQCYNSESRVSHSAAVVLGRLLPCQDVQSNSDYLREALVFDLLPNFVLPTLRGLQIFGKGR